MHSCPDCGEACYCGGDIDDIEIEDPQTVQACSHCGDAGLKSDTGDDPYDDWIEGYGDEE